MDKASAAGRQAGFSLVELMVAMVITLIVSGAIYGLIASGETAFKRDPEISDRQQNVRVAMDVIQRDIAAAGNKMGAFFQVFGDGLDGNGIPSGTGTTWGANSANTDHLVVFTNTGDCPEVPADQRRPPAGRGPSSGGNLNLFTPVPLCYQPNQFVLVVYGNTGSKFGFAFNIHDKLMKVNFPPGQQPPESQINSVACLDSFTCGGGQAPTEMATVNWIRYEIAAEADGTPGLWRSPTGGTIPGLAPYQPAGPGFPGVWQLVARGIEDMQIEYRNGNALGTWAPTPGAVASPDATTIVREVRVTLQARTGALKAARAADVDKMRLRGQLTMVGSPRASLNYLTQTTPTPLWE